MPTLTDYQSQATTWCPHCDAEAPHLKKLLAETTRLTVYHLPGEARMMDWDLTWTAAYGGVHIVTCNFTLFGAAGGTGSSIAWTAMHRAHHATVDGGL